MISNITNIEKSGRTKLCGVLILFLSLAMIPLLGLADFNTKGEPREAVVALSMIQQNNWILPLNNGGEIPYKPPMFHWCVAASTIFTGGVVNEFASRLPSAVALIALAGASFLFFSRRGSVKLALVASLLLVSMLEPWRAAINCRVDMLLAAFSVGAIFELVRWQERNLRRFPWLAIILMSCATLTKGPVGIIIPALVAGCFMLCRGVKFLRAFAWLMLLSLLSLIIPLAWYLAAYQQGGEEFLSLVLEENLGRMMGKMSYDVHIHSWPYNVGMLLSGALPWTLLPLFAISLIGKRKWLTAWQACRSKWRDLGAWLGKGNQLNVLAAVACVVIFIFYCIPKGKRGVYLLPMYPFLAWLLALSMRWLEQNHRRWLLTLAYIFAALSLLSCVAFFADAFWIHRLGGSAGIAECVLALVGAAIAAAWLSPKFRSSSPLPLALPILVLTIYMQVWGAFLPIMMQPKSALPVAQALVAKFPDSDGALYEFIADAEEAAGDPIHFFELNFYLGDKIRNFRRSHPTHGYLVISREDAAKWLPVFEKEGYRFDVAFTPDRPLMKREAVVYRFNLVSND